MPISHINGIVKANVSAMNGVTTGFGGGGGGTVTWESAGAFSLNTSVAYPASIAAGDLLVLIVNQKPQTANGGGCGTPSGWTPLTPITGAGGFGTNLFADNGNTNIFAFYKVAAGSESGSLTIVPSDSSVTISCIHRLTKAGGTWGVASATGSDSTGDATFSISFASDPGTQADDYILVSAIIATDVSGNSTFSAPAISQTGATFDTVTQVEQLATSTGFDACAAVWRTGVLTGPGSANPSFSASVAASAQANGRGPAMFIRIRAS